MLLGKQKGAVSSLLESLGQTVKVSRRRKEGGADDLIVKHIPELPAVNRPGCHVKEIENGEANGNLSILWAPNSQSCRDSPYVLHYLSVTREGKMSKTATVRARIEPRLKKEAEHVLEDLGLSATQAINLFYRQVTLRKGLPFDVVIPNAVTRRTFGSTDAGKDLVVCKDADDMFRRLGI